MNENKYIIQQSTTPEWWIVTDQEHGIVVKFKTHEYNETQEVTLLKSNQFVLDAEAYANHMRKIEKWIIKFHYSKAFRPKMSMRILIGKQIKEIREQQQLSGKELARRAGIEERTIDKIENGRWNVGIDMLEMVCNALGVTIKLQ